MTHVGESIRELAARPFARFVVAGVCGFVTDAAVLTVLVRGLHADPYIARFGSFAAALSVTWTINRLWTFAAAGPRRRRFLVYVGVQIAGAALNLAVYSAILLLVPALKAAPAIALVPASLAGLCVTFLGSKHIVFAPADRTP